MSLSLPPLPAPFTGFLAGLGLVLLPGVSPAALGNVAGLWPLNGNFNGTSASYAPLNASMKRRSACQPSGFDTGITRMRQFFQVSGCAFSQAINCCVSGVPAPSVPWIEALIKIVGAPFPNSWQRMGHRIADRGHYRLRDRSGTGGAQVQKQPRRSQ